jgi:uncharacterized repeat protein (TIGR03943 family)
MNSTVVHHFIKAGILLGFALFFLNLLLSGEILFYIVPSLVIYVRLATIFLVIIALFQLYISIRSIKQPVNLCDCGHHHDNEHSHSQAPSTNWWKNVVVYGLFLLPLALGTLLPNKINAASLVQNKGIQLGGAAYGRSSADSKRVEAEGNEDPALRQLFKTDQYNRDYAKLGMQLYKQDLIEMDDHWFIEKMQALDLFADQFIGKPIKIKGFIYREPGLSDSQFVIGRMAMTHCIADISPYGFIAETNDAELFADDSWVTITGILGITEFQNEPVLKIDIEQVQTEETPSGVSYVYPDWDFASKL